MLLDMWRPKRWDRSGFNIHPLDAVAGAAEVTVTIITPASREEWLELRHPTLGGTETPAMLGVHPNASPFELWAKKSNLVPPTKDNKQLRRGRLLEPIGIELLREERPEWDVVPNVIGEGGKFYQDLEAGLSCTPDAFVLGLPEREGRGVCNIKSVDQHVFRSDWMIDGEIQLPVYVAIQVMQEVHLTGASWGCVGVIVGFDLDFYVIDVEIHAGVIARIKREAPDFLRRVRENDPPDPDYGRDAEAIAALYSDDDGGTVDLSNNERVAILVDRRADMKFIEASGAEAVKQRKTIDAELIHFLGNAACGTLADGRTIEAKTIRKKGFTVEPTSFRSIKIKQQRKGVAA